MSRLFFPPFFPFINPWRFARELRVRVNLKNSAKKDNIYVLEKLLTAKPRTEPISAQAAPSIVWSIFSKRQSNCFFMIITIIFHNIWTRQITFPQTSEAPGRRTRLFRLIGKLEGRGCELIGGLHEQPFTRLCFNHLEKWSKSTEATRSGQMMRSVLSATQHRVHVRISDELAELNVGHKREKLVRAEES